MNKITLPSSLDINCVTSVYEELVDAINRGTPLSFEGANVDHIDTTGLQLLLVLNLHANRIGQRVLISHPSSAIQSAFCLAGFENEFRELTK